MTQFDLINLSPKLSLIIVSVADLKPPFIAVLTGKLRRFSLFYLYMF